MSLDFPDLTERDLRLVSRMTGRLVEAPDLDTLGREFVREMEAILPADCMLWNRWTPAVDEILGFEANDEAFHGGLIEHRDALNATIHHHPVIAAGHTEDTWLRPQRISDYQSYGAFKSNPLFREVYRHLDSHHQIAYNIARLDHSIVILSWNLKRRDFTDRDVQKLHLAGLQVARLTRRLEEAQRLKTVWTALSGRIGRIPEFDAGANGLPLLREKDGRIMAALIQGASREEIAARLHWRRDTLDRYLRELRERMGYENVPQLLHALASLKSAGRKDTAIRHSS